MDMVLYSLLCKEMSKQSECKFWNGFSIEVVNEIPKERVPNTIYLVISDIECTSEDGA